MRKNFVLAAALGTLLLVGAGCYKPAAMSDTKKDDAVILKADGSATTDATVDQLLMDADKEKMQQAEVEKNADDAVSDTSGINTLIQGNYELK
jgi:hypothetical protein